MNGLYVAMVCSGWVTLFVISARRTYRRELGRSEDYFNRMYGQPLPEASHKRALDEAYAMIYKWPAVLILGLFNWVITTEHLLGVPDSETDPWNAPEKFTVIDARPERDGTDELIERLDNDLQEETYLTAKLGPLNDQGTIWTGARHVDATPENVKTYQRPCPCGYRTECPVHCGSGHTTGQCPPEQPFTPGVRYEAP